MKSLFRSYNERRYLRAQQEIAMIEGYADPNSPNPAHRPLPKRRWVRPTLGAWALILGPLSMPTVEGFLPSDQQEQTIERGVSETLGGAVIKVTCIKDSQLLIVGIPGKKAGMAMPFTGFTWNAQSACNGIENFVQKPVTATDLEQQPLSGETEAKIWGLRVVGHEAAHVGLDERNEATAECYALQLVPDMAVAYGMDPALRPLLQKRLLERMNKDHAEGGSEAEEYRFDTTTCRPGGSADLSSQNLGTQVHFPVG